MAKIFRTVIALFLFGSATTVLSQNPITGTTYVEYPSLSPVSAIEVQLADVPSGLFDAVKNAIKLDPLWNCGSPDFYKAAVVDKSGKISRVLHVRAVRLQGHGVDQALSRFTRCNGSGFPGTAHLILDSQVNSSDLIQVFIYADKSQTNVLFKSDGKLSLANAQVLAFTATPQAAPGESLVNGTTRDVGQLNVSMTDTNLFSVSPVNLYVKSKDLFSTDEKDSKSSFSGTFGVQRGLFSSWYAPVVLEQSVQGNQTASNLSTVTNLGINTILPWHWSKSAFNNSFINAPLPPEGGVANQYTHRINQLVTKKTPLLKTDDYSLNPSLTWPAISFPFTCRLLFWQHSNPAGSLPSNCLGTELNLGLWYLPLDLTSAKSQRAEGYGDISILIPLADFSVAAKFLTFVTSGDPNKFQIRIKYADSVNAANNYARSRQWTYGVELLK